MVFEVAIITHGVREVTSEAIQVDIGAEGIGGMVEGIREQIPLILEINHRPITAIITVQEDKSVIFVINLDTLVGIAIQGTKISKIKVIMIQVILQDQVVTPVGFVVVISILQETAPKKTRLCGRHVGAGRRNKTVYKCSKER